MKPPKSRKYNAMVNMNSKGASRTDLGASTDDIKNRQKTIAEVESEESKETPVASRISLNSPASLNSDKKSDQEGVMSAR
jgi:hypothetical protein